MNVRLKRYKKEFEHSYTMGVYPTLELLEHIPEHVLRILIHPKGSGNAGIVKIQTICQQNGISLEIQEKVFNRVGARDNDFAIGVFRKIESQLKGESNHIVLVNPSSTGNLGTIGRTMIGFGFSNLAIIKPAADLMAPDTIRASMGALFQSNFEYFDSIDAYREKYAHNIYTLMIDGATRLPDVRFEQPFGLVFGNESSGLPPEYKNLGTSIRIPQQRTIDSFNLAISVGITIYQASLAQDR
jgi:TrmH family RNA methyltransferase